MGAKVFWIAGPWGGRLGIVPRPRGGEWLGDETRAWREAGVDIVVSLLEPREVAELGLAREPVSSTASGLEFRSFPIPDLGIPDSFESVAALTRDIVAIFAGGKSLVVTAARHWAIGARAARRLSSRGVRAAETAVRSLGAREGSRFPKRMAREWISDVLRGLRTGPPTGAQPHTVGGG